MSHSPELFVKMALMAWDSEITRTNKLLSGVSDEKLNAEISPGRNTGLYILGHLAAVNDSINQILGLGDKILTGYEEVFIKNPDKSGLKKPSAAEVRAAYAKVSDDLAGKLKAVSVDSWFGRHMSVSEEDFAKEPHRNKLNVLISRTNHQSYHRGQLILLVGNE